MLHTLRADEKLHSYCAAVRLWGGGYACVCVCAYVCVYMYIPVCVSVRGVCDVCVCACVRVCSRQARPCGNLSSDYPLCPRSTFHDA
jgi:hypothetical protein